MLSKLRHFAQGTDSGLSVRRDLIDPSPIMRRLGLGGAPVQRLAGGTLNAGFIVGLDGSQRFMKTNLAAGGAAALAKEAEILCRLYAGALAPECLTIEASGQQRTWLIMQALRRPAQSFTPDDICPLTVQLEHRLAGSNAAVGREEDTLALLLEQARKAFENLARSGFLSPGVWQPIERSLREAASVDVVPCPCHGDFGPENIMAGEDGKLYAIDWEDVFIGFSGYDYLYWLTFFKNRKYYFSNVWGRTGLGKSVEISIMAIILLLKSELAVLDGTYKQHSLSFEKRIDEILVLRS